MKRGTQKMFYEKSAGKHLACCARAMPMIVLLVGGSAFAGTFEPWERVTDENSPPAYDPQPSYEPTEAERPGPMPSQGPRLPEIPRDENYAGPNVQRNEPEPDREDIGQQTPVVEVSKPEPAPPLHRVSVSDRNGELSWQISGATYNQVSLIVANSNGRLEQRYGAADTAVLNALSANLPDGQYRYRLVVQDPAYQQLQAELDSVRSEKPCREVAHEYDGIQCYYVESPEERVVEHAVQQKLNSDNFRDTVMVGMLNVSGSRISLPDLTADEKE